MGTLLLASQISELTIADKHYADAEQLIEFGKIK
jgi:hypothetical protein